MTEENKSETRICEVCDAKIAKSEKLCPGCKTDQDELEDSIAAVNRVNAVLKKRADAEEAKKKKDAPPAASKRDPKKSVLRGLARLVK